MIYYLIIGNEHSDLIRIICAFFPIGPYSNWNYIMILKYGFNFHLKIEAKNFECKKKTKKAVSAENS